MTSSDSYLTLSKLDREALRQLAVTDLILEPEKYGKEDLIRRLRDDNHSASNETRRSA